jgi:hypothetical protein
MRGETQPGGQQGSSGHLRIRFIRGHNVGCLSAVFLTLQQVELQSGKELHGHIAHDLLRVHVNHGPPLTLAVGGKDHHGVRVQSRGFGR